MQIYTEKKAEEFLRKEGFEVVDGNFFKGEKELDDFLKSAEFPLVMKVSGEKIIHKKSLGGVKTNLNNYGSSIKAFEELMKVEGADGVLLQKQICGTEILLGIKKTPEFGHVLSFGQGGSLVEKIADIGFRVCPLKEEDIDGIIQDTDIGEMLNSKEKEILEKNIKKLCLLVSKYPDILELDINPLILTEERGIIVDARVSWE